MYSNHKFFVLFLNDIWYTRTMNVLQLINLLCTVDSHQRAMPDRMNKHNIQLVHKDMAFEVPDLSIFMIKKSVNVSAHSNRSFRISN